MKKNRKKVRQYTSSVQYTLYQPVYVVFSYKLIQLADKLVIIAAFYTHPILLLVASVIDKASSACKVNLLNTKKTVNFQNPAYRGLKKIKGSIFFKICQGDFANASSALLQIDLFQLMISVSNRFAGTAFRGCVYFSLSIIGQGPVHSNQDVMPQ